MFAGSSAGRRAFSAKLALPLLAILALKVVLLAIYAPIAVPDTPGYVDYSDEILAGSTWLRDARLDRAPAPASTIHMVGYPLLIAAARSIAPPYWSWTLIALQITLSLAAMAALYALRRPLGLSDRVMLFALFAVATTSSLVHDATLLPDSLHASLLVLAIATLTIAALSDRSLRAPTALAIGLLLATAFLLRDAMSYLWLSLLPLLVCAAVRPAIASERRRAALRGAMVVALALFPLFAAHIAYTEWNRQRAGTPFVTTIAQLTLPLTLAAAAAHEPAIFAGDTPFDQAARDTFRRYDYKEVLELNRRLFDTWSQTGPEISASAYDKYFAAWRQHPAAMAHAVLANLREKHFFLLFQPIHTLREYQLWATGAQSEWGRWKPGETDGCGVFVYLVDLLCKAIASVILGGFLLLTPWRAWRDGLGSAVARVRLALWLLCFGWYAIFAMVHLETRYLAPIIPFAVLISLANMVWIAPRRAVMGGAASRTQEE